MKKLYTVYKKATDELVAFELPKYRCIELMGVKPQSFDRIKQLCKRGEKTPWEIFETDGEQIRRVGDPA